jgi:hypothetical protein
MTVNLQVVKRHQHLVIVNHSVEIQNKISLSLTLEK